MRGAPGLWLACLLLVSALSARGEEAPMKLTTGRPCNLFPHGEKVAVQATATPDAWRVTDFAGKEVLAGKGAIELGALPRGYYEVTAKAGESSARLAFGVVTDHSAEDPPSGRLNVDGATAWLEREGRHDDLARALRIAGIGWVRERFSWAQTEPAKDQVAWHQYDAVADAFTRHGVRVYQIFHDSPAWSHGGRKNTRNPQDLRDAYRFAKRLAEHYQGRVRAWEVWNEPDIFFWPDLSDTFAGLQKAAYLGFKAGEPDLPVLLGSFCRGYCEFDERLFEAGIADYFDVFNWHVYAPPQHYPATLRRYLEVLARYGCEGRPVWLTEAGIRLKAKRPDGELTAADERRQADFVPKSFAWSLAAGTDRHFFFVYPYYLENGVQFGALRKDLSPRPGFVAIAAAVDILGEARYLGAVVTPQRGGYTALAFHSGREAVLVAWSGERREVELAVGAERVTVADMVGRRESRDTPKGKLALTLGPSPQYVMGVGGDLSKSVTGEPRAVGKRSITRACPMVVRGQAPGAALDKGADCYLIGDKAFTYAVEVCNLSERSPAAGRVRLELPAGWKVEPGEARVALEAMGRVVQEFTVTPAAVAVGTQRVWVRPEFEGLSPAPSVSGFRFDLSRVKPGKALGLGLDDPARWQANISGNGTMAIRAGQDGGVRFEVRFTAAGDRWCYPRVDLGRPQDFSAYDGIAFEYRCGAEGDGTVVRFQAIEPNGSAYFTSAGWPARKAWTRAACVFGDLDWGSFSPKDPNGKLDTRAIRSLMIGLNTPRDAVWLEVRGAELVKVQGE